MRISLILQSLLLPLTLSATSIVPPTLEELVSESEVIVLAEITKIRSRDPGDDPHGRSIYSEISFNVLKSYKGGLKADEKREFFQPGGCVLDRCMQISLFPGFRAGETVVLLLTREGSAEYHPFPAGLGSFRIDAEGNLVGSGKSLSSFERELKKSIRSSNQKDRGITASSWWFDFVSWTKSLFNMEKL